jgi:hypothetical protein
LTDLSSKRTGHGLRDHANIDSALRERSNSNDRHGAILSGGLQQAAGDRLAPWTTSSTASGAQWRRSRS